MFRLFIRFAIVATIGILGYNYIYGTASEKESSTKVFKGVGGIFKDVKDVLVAEKGKYDKGKYDLALSKMQDVIGKLKEHAVNTKDNALSDEATQLEKQKEGLKSRSDKMNSGVGAETSTKLQEAADLMKQLENLHEKAQKLVKKTAPTAE
jgi:predicted phage tail protein